MKVELHAIDRERFHVNAVMLDGIGQLFLVVPQKGNHTWGASELHMRSLLCRPDGTVVSAGFPKFFNAGENARADAIVTFGLANGMSSIKDKLDGSLIIRTVIDGVVNLRTRGCEQIASDMRFAVEALIASRYPFLLDPSFESSAGRSMLMEYVGLDNQIVVRYDESRLVYLGMIDFSGDKLIIVDEDLPTGCTLPVASTRLLPNDIDGLKQTVTSFVGEEGVVVWTHTDEGMELCKFKSAWYMRLHALRSQATPRYIREFCVANGIDTVDDLKRSLMAAGFDWETCSQIESTFNVFAHERDAALRRFDAVHAEIDRLGLISLQSRKDKAALAGDIAARHGQDMFGYMMAVSTGNVHLAIELSQAIPLGWSVNEFRSVLKRGVENPGSMKTYDDA